MHGKIWLSATVLGLLATTGIISSTAFAQQAPYPASAMIAGIDWQLDTHVQFAPGSDQWPLTWAKDGSLYAGWGDGWGWVKDKQKFSLGVTRIDGEPPELKGSDLWGIGAGSGVAKPEALIAIGDKLYLFWTKGPSKSDTDNTHDAVSTDGGKTWKINDKPLLAAGPDGFRVRGICQFGPGYAGTLDEFVYIYFGFNQAAEIYLVRVTKEAVDDSSLYEWFTGTAASDGATWTKNFTEKQPVFRDPAGYVWHIGVSYHPVLRRFLLSKPHQVEGKNVVTGIGVFDAPTPWGPWTTVLYQDRLKDDLMKFTYFLPPKFFDADGRTLWLVWSGYPEYDNVNFVRGTLRLMPDTPK